MTGKPPDRQGLKPKTILIKLIQQKMPKKKALCLELQLVFNVE